jgi:hypothetical protein
VRETGARITLVRGTNLVIDMIELGLGVKTVPVVRHDVDDDLFSSLQSWPYPEVAQ